MPQEAEASVEASAALVSLLTPDFRCSVALAHRVRNLLLELHTESERTVRVSHDSAFVPVMTPCHLRLAVAQTGAGHPPDWLGSVTGWTVGGPLVDPLGFGAVGHDRSEGRVGSFATTLTPEVVAGIVEAESATRGDDGEGFAVAVTGDSAVGATVVSVLGEHRVAAAVDELTRWIATSCRHEEWGRDTAGER